MSGRTPSLALDHQHRRCPRPHPTPRGGPRSPPSHVIHTVHQTIGQAERSHQFPQPSLLKNGSRQRSGQRANSSGLIRHDRDSSRGHATRPPPTHGKAPSGIQALTRIAANAESGSQRSEIGAEGELRRLWVGPRNPVSDHAAEYRAPTGDEILAWHSAGRPSNGRIEGTNNLLQVLRRVAHGFTNPTNFAARGLLVT